MMSEVSQSSYSMVSDEDQLPAFFDREPQLKAKLQEYLHSIPLEQRQANVERFRKFLTGELTWAEIKGLPKSMLKELARIGHQRLMRQDFKGAEVLFKGLAIIDHSNWYYRAALGATFKQQNQFEQAVEELTIAITLKSDEPSCLVNRGECFLRLGNADAALEDFVAVKALGLVEADPWGKRAAVLSQLALDPRAKE